MEMAFPGVASILEQQLWRIRRMGRQRVDTLLGRDGIWITEHQSRVTQLVFPAHEGQQYFLKEQIHLGRHQDLKLNVNKEIVVSSLCCFYCLVIKSCLTLLHPHGLYPTRLLCSWDLPFPSPGDLPHPETEPTSPALAGRFFTIESPGKCSPFWEYMCSPDTYIRVHMGARTHTHTHTHTHIYIYVHGLPWWLRW